ncbi:MAG: aldehyde dehydrogenase family protein [Oligoflexia bacterium]|nr:aldehyde dehydrogenase family protein [Oligoflexia bacterium]MBF0367051.1 aldehyde dehydrogenase family protein [Oligoflexia bacterium]
MNKIHVLLLYVFLSVYLSLISVPLFAEGGDGAKKGLYQVNREQFFSELAGVLNAHQSEFATILTRVDNHYGAMYEIAQATKTAKGVHQHEELYLNKMEGVENVAVYGARNIPLYTMMMHALIPAVISKDVWFRTPEMTRDIYVALFNKIKELMPQYDFSNLHLLVDKSDVQYDNFRKKYILGLNKRGNHFEHRPADAVIFIGSPETGDRIQQEIYDKVTALKDKVPPFKQIFLRFGSGLNPVIITEHSSKVIDAAVQGTVESIKVNNTQDCIAPKFYAIHSDLHQTFLDKLVPIVKQLKFGSTKDPDADYARLNFATDLKDLLVFKEKYKDYLLNPEAVIDEGTMRVDPHVFSFPFKMFKDVPLNDFYAPFILLFEYSSDDLKAIANDPRVRERAMYASIYGDSGNIDMWKIRKQFEDNFHSTVLNLNVYDEESGNFPFGGYGGTASTVTLMSKEGLTPAIERFSINRPLLFSRDGAQFISQSQSMSVKEQVQGIPAEDEDKETREKYLQSILLLASDAKTATILPSVIERRWNLLRKRQDSSRPYGLNAIREKITSGGLASVIYCRRYQMSKQEIEYFWGTKVICIEDHKVEKVSGVVLHNEAIGVEAIGMNRALGEINPNQGYGYLVPLMKDRVIEYRVTNAISPGLMPKSEVYADFEREIPRELTEKMQNARQELNEYVVGTQLAGSSGAKSREELKEKVKSTLKEVITELFTFVQSRHPMGTYVKNYGESTTGDLGIQMTTFHYNPNNIVNQFMDRLEVALSETKERLTSFDQPLLQQQMMKAHYETGTKVLSSLMTNPAELLFQERVKLAKTDLGFIREIRVDFMDGEPVSAHPRYSHEYMREDEEEAKAVIRNFFAKAPEYYRYLSGGADVAKTEEGKWVIIELNTGANSGSAVPFVFPIERHRYISTLQGKNTPFLEKLERLFASSLEEQRNFLQSIPASAEEEKWQKFNIGETSLAEYAKWFRDRYLDEWRKNPTKESAEATLLKLKKLYAGLGSEYNRDLQLYVRGSENYLTTKLMMPAVQ